MTIAEIIGFAMGQTGMNEEDILKMSVVVDSCTSGGPLKIINVAAENNTLYLMVQENLP